LRIYGLGSHSSLQGLGQLLDNAPLLLPSISGPDSATSPNFTDKAPLILGFLG